MLIYERDDFMKNYYNKINQSWHFNTIIIMAQFTFLFLGLEYLFDNMMSLVTSQENVVLAQNCVLGMSTIGFLLYFLIHRLLKNSMSKTYVMVANFISIFFMIMICQHISYGMTLLFGLLLFLFLGLIGSAVYYYAICHLHTRTYLARHVGISYMLGILFQFINNNFLNNMLVENIIFAICLTYISFFLMKEKTSDHFQNDFPNDNGHLRQTTAILLILLIVCMTFIFSTLDNVVTLVHASGKVDIGQWPRIFLALSGLAAGFLFDLQQRKYMNLIMYCIMILSTICIFVIDFGGSFLIGLLVFYISAGFFAVYFTTSFMELSCYMKETQLWAGMGRAVNNMTAVMMTQLSLTLVTDKQPLNKIIVILVLFVLISVVMFLYTSKRDILCQEKHDTDLKNKLENIIELYSLTQRESEVLDKLVNSDDSLQEVAQNLYISKRTLERHISSIYKKTNTKSRIGLVRLYHES